MPRIFTSLLLAATTHALSLPVVKQFGRIKGDGFKVRDLKGEGPNQGIVELWLGAASLNAASVDGVSRIQKCVAVDGCRISGEMVEADVEILRQACAARVACPMSCLVQSRDDCSTRDLADALDGALRGRFAIAPKEALGMDVLNRGINSALDQAQKNVGIFGFEEGAFDSLAPKAGAPQADAFDPLKGVGNAFGQASRNVGIFGLADGAPAAAPPSPAAAPPSNARAPPVGDADALERWTERQLAPSKTAAAAAAAKKLDAEAKAAASAEAADAAEAAAAAAPPEAPLPPQPAFFKIEELKAWKLEKLARDRRAKGATDAAAARAAADAAAAAARDAAAAEARAVEAVALAEADAKAAVAAAEAGAPAPAVRPPAETLEAPPAATAAARAAEAAAAAAVAAEAEAKAAVARAEAAAEAAEAAKSAAAAAAEADAAAAAAPSEDDGRKNPMGVLSIFGAAPKAEQAKPPPPPEPPLPPTGRLGSVKMRARQAAERMLDEEDARRKSLLDEAERKEREARKSLEKIADAAPAAAASDDENLSEFEKFIANRKAGKSDEEFWADRMKGDA